jgi:hypothetical protein
MEPAMLELLHQYAPQIVAATLTAVIALVGYWLQPRVKLRWGLSHGYDHRVIVPAPPQPPQHQGQPAQQVGPPQPQIIFIHTASHLIVNDGRATATQVEVTFNFVPASLEIWPQRQFQTAPNPNGRFVVRFDSLSPKERLTVNVLTADRDAPDLLSVRASEIMGKQINYAPSPVLSRGVIILLWALIFLGTATVIYMAILAAQWFVRLAALVPT